MRYKMAELSPQDKPQYLIALGVRDIELLLAEAENAALHFPRTADAKEDKQRLDGIVKGLTSALKAARDYGDTGEKVPVDERYKFRDEYLDKVNRFEIIDHRPCKGCKGTGIVKNAKDESRGMICGECEGSMTKGRKVVFWDNHTKISSSVQDDGKTLKVFIENKPTEIPQPEELFDDVEKFIKDLTNIFRM